MMKKIISIGGICISIIGWLFLNADHFPRLYQIFLPKYSNSISALDKMRQKDFILKQSETGFSEITEILKEFIRGDKVPIITQIKTLNWWQGPALMSRPQGPKWSNYCIEIEISFANGKPVTATFYDLKLQAEERFLFRYKFFWGTLFFWCGIVFNIIGLFIKQKKTLSR